MDFFTTIPKEEQKASFLKNLRSATGPKHTALESNELLASLTSDSLTLRKYFHYLILMREVEHAYTLMLDRSPVLHQLSGRVSAAPLITQDLAAITSNEFFTANPISCRLPFENSSLAFQLGFSYVMKGSRLGGKVIYKHIHRNLGFSEQSGAGYILDAGNDTFADWKRFLAALSDFAVENNCTDEIIAGAIAGFSAIHYYFESNRMLYAD